MPKGTKIAPADRVGWLEASERGGRIDVIARKAKRTERTIKSHIEIARRERDLQRIRADLLRSAYQQHYQDIIGIVQGLKAQAQSPQQLRLSPGSDVRSRLLYDGLRTHLPKGRLWDAVSAWEESAASLRTAHQGLSQEIRKQVHLRLVPLWEELNLDWMAQSLMEAAEQAAMGLEPSLGDYRIAKEGKGWSLDCGIFKLAQGIPTKGLVEQLKTAHERIVAKLASLEQVARLKEGQDEWEGAREALDTEIEVLSLSRVLSGSCRLCPGSDYLMKERRSSKRSKKE